MSTDYVIIFNEGLPNGFQCLTSNEYWSDRSSWINTLISKYPKGYEYWYMGEWYEINGSVCISASEIPEEYLAIVALYA